MPHLCEGPAPYSTASNARKNPSPLLHLGPVIRLCDVTHRTPSCRTLSRHTLSQRTITSLLSETTMGS